jgi:VWFA-related protein
MRFAIAIGLVLALAAPQHAQPPQPESQLVTLNVIAVDAHGDPVTDLTADDFQITDAGKLQKIAFFRHRDEKLVLPASPSPNQFSNRTGANPPHPTVILFDLLNERPEAWGDSWNELVHFLQPQETAEDLYLYLITADGRLYPVHGFSGGGTGPSWTRQIKPLMDAAMREAARAPGLAVYDRARFTYEALDRLALEMSRVPGSKNIVWVTAGVPVAMNPRNLVGEALNMWTWQQLQEFGEELARSGVAIYPVQQIMIGSQDAGSPGPRGSGAAINAGLDDRRTLDELAGLTGGRLNQGKDIGEAVTESRNDLRTSYQIGYFPPPGNWDAKFHKLRVTCNRKGVRIQAKTGYSALKDAHETDTRHALDAAASADFDAAEIGLRVTMSPDGNDPQMEHFGLHINANDIALPRQDARYTAQLRLTAIAYLANGRNEDSKIVQLDPHYSPAERDQVLQNGIDIHQDMKVEPNVKQIRFVVFDRYSSTVGSITIPVTAGGHLP